MTGSHEKQFERSDRASIVRYEGLAASKWMVSPGGRVLYPT